MVFHEPELGGASLSLLRLVPLLERRGWGFSFWVPGPGPAEAELRARGYPVVAEVRLLRFSRRGLREAPGPIRRVAATPAYLKRWRAWLRAQDATLIHANTLLSLPEVVTRPRAGPPLVLHNHEVLAPGLRGTAAALLARRADTVIAVSEAAARPLRRRGIDPRVVHPGVPDPGRSRRAAADGRLVVGTLGTVSTHKGSELFLAAAERIRASANGVEFRIAGRPAAGSERPWAEELLAAARRSGVVHRPWVDPYEELAEWDVLVMPSRTDAFPLAVLEAMAMGLPVVATNVGGIPEQLGENAGILVDSEDVEAIAAAVLRLARSPQLRAALGDEGRRRRERLFTLERQAEQLDAVYRSTLAAAAAA
jgi:glycosyltransferase involved in cell wall biosynthesis